MADCLINNSLVHKLLYCTLETNYVIVKGSATSMNVGVSVMRFVLSEEAARVALLGVDV